MRRERSQYKPKVDDHIDQVGFDSKGEVTENCDIVVATFIVFGRRMAQAEMSLNRIKDRLAKDCNHPGIPGVLVGYPLKVYRHLDRNPGKRADTWERMHESLERFVGKQYGLSPHWYDQIMEWRNGKTDIHPSLYRHPHQSKD